MVFHTLKLDTKVKISRMALLTKTIGDEGRVLKRELRKKSNQHNMGALPKVNKS